MTEYIEGKFYEHREYGKVMLCKNHELYIIICTVQVGPMAITIRNEEVNDKIAGPWKEPLEFVVGRRYLGIGNNVYEFIFDGRGHEWVRHSKPLCFLDNNGNISWRDGKGRCNSDLSNRIGDIIDYAPEDK